MWEPRPAPPDGVRIGAAARFLAVGAPPVRTRAAGKWTSPCGLRDHLSRDFLDGGESLALPLGFTPGTSIQAPRIYYDGAGQVHLTLDRKPLPS